ncbi:hypothetical protein [Actinomadura sp. 9N407]|uniref:hypothetical protein n=1 Tax=Actinomadura sp. 9N407 TaxID=3375154 RepID=UPI00378E7E19
MDELVTEIIVIAVVLLIIASVVVRRFWGPRSLARRAKALSDVADSQGWTFTAEHGELVPLVQRLPQSLGRARDLITSAVVRSEPTRLDVGSRILHVLKGTVGTRRVLIFDWLAGHGTGAGRAALVFLHTVWAVPLPQPQFWVQAASRSQPHDRWRPGRAFQTGDEAFDKRFLTTADDAGHVTAGLTPQTRRMLLESGFDGWRLDPELQMLLLWTHSRRRYAPVEQILPMTQQAMRIAADAIATQRRG